MKTLGLTVGLALVYITSLQAQSAITLWDWHCDPLAPGVLGLEVCYGVPDFGPQGLTVDGLKVRSTCDPADRKAHCSPAAAIISQALAGADRDVLHLRQAGYGPFLTMWLDFWPVALWDEFAFVYTARSIRIAGIFALHCGEGARVEPGATLTTGVVQVGRAATGCDILLDRSNPNPWPGDAHCLVVSSQPGPSPGVWTEMAGADHEMAVIHVTGLSTKVVPPRLTYFCNGTL